MAISAARPLTLTAPPELSAGVPCQWRVIEKPELLGNLAAALHRCGILRWNGDVLADVETSLAAHAKAIGNRLPEMLKDKYDLTLTDNYARHMDGCHGDADKDCAIALTNEIEPLLFDPRRTVKYLESVARRLGYTVLQAVEEALNDLTGCCGPWNALGMAGYVHWMGESNEKAAVAEIAQMNDCKQREVEFELTRKEFDADFPKGMFTFKPLDKAAIQNAIPRVTKRLRPLLEVALQCVEWNECGNRARGWSSMKERLSQTDREKGWLPNDIFEVNAGDRMDSFILFWKPWGMVGRCYDDYANNIYQSGTNHQFAALCTFNPENEESIIDAFRNMDAIVDRLAALVTILPLLAKPLNREEQN